MIQPITKEDMNRAEPHSYWRTRWDGYMGTVAEMLSRLPDGRVLELGAYTCPMVPGSDTMDNKRHLPGLTILHDATEFPWPIEDKKYRVFVALQVWEHLEGAQKRAFLEARRVAEHVILCFPLRLKCRDEWNAHNHMNEGVIQYWTCGHSPRERRICGPRIVYRWGPQLHEGDA